MRVPIAFAICAVLASTTQAARVSRIVPRSVDLQLQAPKAATVELERVADHSDPNPVFSPSGVISARLNCENDLNIDGFNTLVLDVGDLAGTIFPVPNNPKPYLIAEIDLGLVDFNSTYPAQIDLILFESDATGSSFDSIAGFSVDFDTPVASGGEIVSIDLRQFDIRGENDLLVLYGDAGGSANALLLPAGDGSPRCATQSFDNICSVHLPAGSPDLFIYGTIDAGTCFRTTHGIKNFDVVMEVLLEEILIPVSETSFGAVKARF